MTALGKHRQLNLISLLSFIKAPHLHLVIAIPMLVGKEQSLPASSWLLLLLFRQRDRETSSSWKEPEEDVGELRCQNISVQLWLG